MGALEKAPESIEKSRAEIEIRRIETVQIGYKTQKSPSDLRKFVVTLTKMKENNIKLVLKIR